MSILDIEAPLIAAPNGPVRLHSEYVLPADIVLATPATATVFQDKPHFEFRIVPCAGVNLLSPEVIGGVRGRYFILRPARAQRRDSQGVWRGQRQRHGHSSDDWGRRTR